MRKKIGDEPLLPKTRLLYVLGMLLPPLVIFLFLFFTTQFRQHLVKYHKSQVLCLSFIALPHFPNTRLR